MTRKIETNDDGELMIKDSPTQIIGTVVAVVSIVFTLAGGLLGIQAKLDSQHADTQAHFEQIDTRLEIRTKEADSIHQALQIQVAACQAEVVSLEKQNAAFDARLQPLERAYYSRH